MTANTDGAMPELPEPDGYAAISGGGTIIVPPRDFAKHNGYAIFTANQMREYARAAIQAAGAVPEGWKLVPVEPTIVQCEACLTEARYQFDHSITINAAVHLYRVFMAASPAPPKQQPVHLGGGEGGGVPQPRYRLLNNGDVIEKHDEFIQDDGVTWLNPVGWEVGARYGPPFKTARRPESPTGRIKKEVGHG